MTIFCQKQTEVDYELTNGTIIQIMNVYECNGKNIFMR
jgi:hypothetical protein